jgi:hypothetical protein
MATNFPTSVDNFTNPTANDSLNLPSHSTQHANANDAIEAVEDYLLNGAGKAGLVHINSTTITSATQVSANNVFTSAYRNYLILIDAREATATDINLTLRLRAGGTDNSASSYDLQTNGRTGTTQFGDLVNASAQWTFAIGNRAHQSVVLQIMTPQIAMPTLIQSASLSGDMGANLGATIQVGDHRDNYQADGFTAFFTNSTNGVVRVYGYRD